MSPSRPHPRGLLAGLAVLTALVAAPAAQAAGPLALTSRLDEPTPVGVKINERIAVADVNGDGIDDHAVSRTNGATIYFGARGSATGGGTMKLSVDVGGAGAVGISSAGDADGDGFDDLLLINQRAGTRTFLVHGAASNPAELAVAGSPRTTVITNGTWITPDTRARGIGDFNGDGKDDFVVPTANGASASAGPSGVAIVAGGPRVAQLDARTAGGRISRFTGYHRCTTRFIIYAPYFSTYCHAPAVTAAGVGDVNGDGRDDVAVNANEGRSESIVLGRAATGFTASAMAPGAGSVSLNALPVGGPYYLSSRAGDVDGDGIDDFFGGGGVIRGRTSMSGALPANEPVVKFEPTPGLNLSLVAAVGDQNGDGRDDLLMTRGAVYASNPELVITTLPSGATTFPRSGHLPVGGDRPTAQPGLAGSDTQGDLDGDGAVDAVVNDGEAVYRLTHAGAATKPRLLARTTYVDWRGERYSGGRTATTAVCSGQSRTVVSEEYDDAVFGADGSLSIGDRCTLSATPPEPREAFLQGCVWKASFRFRGESVPAGATVTIGGEPNRWEQTLTCAAEPVGTEVLPQAFFTGWQAAGSARVDAGSTAKLTNGPNQVGSVIWPHAISPAGTRITFSMRMERGNGSAEGVALAFLNDVGGQPTGTLGAGGGQLGFGGLLGRALVFDAFKQPEDVQANMVNFVDRAEGSSLRRLTTRDAGLRLRGNLVTVTVDIRPGRIDVVHNGRGQTIEATLPDSVFLAFTGSTSAVWQEQLIQNVTVTRLP